MRLFHAGGILVLVIGATLASTAATGDVRLIEAVKSGNTATMRTLSKQRALVTATEADGTTALHWAARLDRAEFVQALIRAGAPVNAKNRYAVTPLSLAAVNGSAAVVDALLKAGADANTSGHRRRDRADARRSHGESGRGAAVSRSWRERQRA